MTSHHYLEKEIRYTIGKLRLSFIGWIQQLHLPSSSKQTKTENEKQEIQNSNELIESNSFEKQTQINIRSQLSLLGYAYNNNLNPKNANKTFSFFFLSEYIFFCSKHSSIVKPTVSLIVSRIGFPNNAASACRCRIYDFNKKT